MIGRHEVSKSLPAANLQIGNAGAFGGGCGIFTTPASVNAA
jgi:hypothetical protein